MSRIPDLSSDPNAEGEAKYDLLPDLIAEYDDFLDEVETNMSIKGKGLEEANVENAAWQVRYDQKRVELRTLIKYFEMEINRVRGKLYQKFREGHSIALGEREINNYINKEPAYLRVKGYQMEIDELYEKYKTVVEGFTARGYALNNITKLRVAQLEGVAL